MAGVPKPSVEGAFTKLKKLWGLIKHNGGIRGSLYALYRTDELYKGDLIGEDKYGNKYYQNNEYIVGRNKWVVYSDKVGMDYDGSQVPAEWHRWLSDMTDTPPNVKPPEQHRWMLDHQENQTGRQNRYIPYSTTRPKIDAWTPPKN